MLNHQNLLKRRLAAGETALGLWITLESPSITELAVALGYDWVCIDAEHGSLGFREIQEHVRLTRGTGTTALVRIQEVQQGLIKRVLDLGADGIIIPQVYSASEVEQAVRFAKYPPWGIRGLGGERATTWGLEVAAYTVSANQEIMVIPMIETLEAGKAVEEIVAVRGVDAIYFGPADYSSSAGYLGQWEGPGVAEAILAIKDQATARGCPTGIMATSVANAEERRKQGFQMLCLGSDTSLLIRATRDAMTALGRSNSPGPSPREEK